MNLSKTLLDAYSVLFEGTKTRKVYNVHYAQQTPMGVARKYSGDDYFVRFVNTWEDEKNQKVNEVGVKIVNRSKYGDISVSSTWNNPRGIYCYWLDDYKSGTNASFGTGHDHMYIIKRRHVGNQIDDIGNLPRNQFVEYSNKLKSYIISSGRYEKIKNEDDYLNFIKKVESGSSNKSDGGILFYAVVILGSMGNNVLHDVHQTYVWRNVLGVTFIGDKGHGIIHPSEKAQALFLDRKAYEVLHKLKNENFSYVDKLINLGKNDELINIVKSGYVPTSDDMYSAIVNRLDANVLTAFLDAGGKFDISRPRALGQLITIYNDIDMIKTAIEMHPEMVAENGDFLITAAMGRPNLDDDAFEILQFLVDAGANSDSHEVKVNIIERGDMNLASEMANRGFVTFDTYYVMLALKSGYNTTDEFKRLIIDIATLSPDDKIDISMALSISGAYKYMDYIKFVVDNAQTFDVGDEFIHRLTGAYHGEEYAPVVDLILDGIERRFNDKYNEIINNIDEKDMWWISISEDTYLLQSLIERGANISDEAIEKFNNMLTAPRASVNIPRRRSPQKNKQKEE